MRVPTSTYRLQFNNEFRFDDARALVPYLAALGVSDVYASPILAARAGSPHGYDVTDPTRINLELGGERAFDAFTDALEEHGLGLIVDIVPNHMAASTENPWWRDVLEHGRASDRAEFFDIDWAPHCDPLGGRLVLPILGRHYGRALEKGELQLVIDDDGLAVRYYDHRLPLDPATYPRVLAPDAPPTGSTAAALPAPASGSAAPAVVPAPFAADGRELEAAARRADTALGDLAHRFAQLAPPSTSDPQRARLRRHRAASLKRELRDLYTSDAAVRRRIGRNIEALGGTAGDPRSFDALDALLTAQPYLLAFWKTGSESINYRRFFNISDLVCVRMERETVFETMHALILRLFEEGRVTGMRIDHVDGLYDPTEYLRRLAARAAGAYIVVEKILSRGETLPADWPAAGTTGYDFLNTLNGLFVDPSGLERLGRVYSRFIDSAEPFAEIVYRKKKQIIERYFGSEIAVLSRALHELSAADRHGRDLAPRLLGRAIAEVTACLPFYRTYTCDRLDDTAREGLEPAFAEARRRNPALGTAAFDMLWRVLMLQLGPGETAATRRTWVRFVMRWQQFSGPVMAKGIEDGALYVYNRLVSLNEVGGDPDDGAISVQEFHRRNRARQERWPAAMNATSTHDTKRSEDVRARIAVLSEIPALWAGRLRRWNRWNRGWKTRVRGTDVPVPNEEVLLYQTLIGVWPLDDAELPDLPRRIEGYMVKATREAKEHTSWLRQDTEHEDAIRNFVRRTLEPAAENRFLHDMLRFQREVAFYGAINSLAQLVLKTAAPGVPDFYQGTELWDFSLVDPDNRRPLDLLACARALERLQQEERAGQHHALVARLTSEWRNGQIKLYVTYRALDLRRELPDLFHRGQYIALETAGARAAHLCAFAREESGEWVVAAAPRGVTRLSSPGQFPIGERTWHNDALILPGAAPTRWCNVLTGETLQARSAPGGHGLALGTLLASLPVALLRAE